MANKQYQKTSELVGKIQKQFTDGKYSYAEIFDALEFIKWILNQEINSECDHKKVGQ